jgi:hypothetical protein
MQDTPGTHLAGVDNAILKHIIVAKFATTVKFL